MSKCHTAASLISSEIQKKTKKRNFSGVKDLHQDAEVKSAGVGLNDRVIRSGSAASRDEVWRVLSVLYSFQFHTVGNMDRA